jgi:hypothetical protein
MIAITYTFSPSTTAASSQVNQNFSDLVTATNDRIPSSGWIEVSDSWSYASADGHGFTITVPAGAAAKYSAGMRIKLTQASTVRYFIIQIVADTLLTVYGGTDYTLANSAITSINYSPVKAPLGFPMSPIKWTEISSTSTQGSQASPTQNVYYNLGGFTLNVPIGMWDLSYQVVAGCYKSGGTVQIEMLITLATVTNNDDDKEFNVWLYNAASSSVLTHVIETVTRNKIVSLTTKKTYYLIAKAGQPSMSEIDFRNEVATGVIKAVNAYL